MRMYMCGVPDHICSGKTVQTPGSVSKSMRDIKQGSGKCGTKAHMSPSEAHRCFGKFLITEGYTKLSSREYTKGPDSPITLLPKPSHFGGILISGKKGDKGGPGKKRFSAQGMHGVTVQLV